MRMFKQSSGSNQGHLALTHFDAYQDGVLTEAQKAAFRQHLDSCSECRASIESQIQITRQLVSEASPQATLSPAAVARIQKNVSSRMRRALIMNNVRNVTGATAAAAVLVLVVVFFVWQSRLIDIVGIGKPVQSDLVAMEQAVPEVEEPAVEADSEQPTVVEPVTDEQLFEAVSAADAAAVEQLLAAGANPDAIKPSGYPILKQAILDSIKSRNTDIVTLLVENGADVNQLDSAGNAMLPMAAAAGAPQLEVVQLLLDAGADPNGTSAVTDPYLAASVTWAGIDTTFADSPALIHAVLGNNVDVVELLIAHGADLELAESSANLTALHTAAGYNRPTIVETLLAHGANPDPPGSRTPLQITSVFQDVRSAQILLDGGADPNAQTEKGETPLILAVNQRIAPRLDTTAPKTSTGIVTVLLEGGADPNLADENGKTALHYAAAFGKDEAVQILIEHGASIDVQDNYSNTALHSAAKNGESKVLSILIEQGAALDIQNEEGQTALDVAKDEAIIELLTGAGAGS